MGNARTAPASHGERFRILSLDGGGVRGAFTAAALAAFEASTGKRALDHFDLIAGTSTGGIIALGLALGVSAEEIVNFYRAHGPTIFPSTGLHRRVGSLFRHLIRPKHSHAVLRRALETIFRDRTFGEAKTRVVIPTYDAIGGRIFLLKTAHHDRFDQDHRALAVDVALATSAAPTYFAASRFEQHAGASYVDGGVWANCPVLVAVIEATSFIGIPADRVEVLSIGTTTETFNVAGKGTKGILGWNKSLLSIFMNSQSQAALAQASLLTGGRVHRVDQLVGVGRYNLDNARSIDELIALGRGVASKLEHREVVAQRFLNGRPVAPFAPLHRVAS